MSGRLSVAAVMVLSACSGNRGQAAQASPSAKQAPAPASERKRSMSNVDYTTYGRDLRGGHASVGPGGSLSAAFGADGQGFLSISTNLDDGQEIGLYRGRLPPADVERLIELLRQSAYEQIAPPEALRPDAPTMSVGHALKGQTTPTVRAFRVDQVPAAVRPYEQAAREAVQALLDHRERVVRGSARAERERFVAGQPLVFAASLENVGASPVAVSAAVANLRVRLERDKTAAALDWEKDVWILDPAAVGGDGGGGRATLAPGEALTFTVKVKPPAAVGSGALRAVVTWFSSPKPGGKVPGLDGNLSMRTPRFEIESR